MPKLPNKALLSCLTLVATSAGLEQANAAEINIETTGLDPNNSAASATSDDADSAEVAPEVVQQQTITPDSTPQPSFTPQQADLQESEETTLALASPSQTTGATLEHLVATASREIPSNSQLLTEVGAPERWQGLDDTVVVEADSVVEGQQGLDDTVVVEVDSPEISTAIAAPTTIPTAAIPKTIVSVPPGVTNTTPAAAPAARETTARPAAQTRETIELAQIPVQDSSGVVGDSFRPEELTDDELRQVLSVDNPVLPTTPPSPASSFGTPTAYGANGGDAFIGLAGVTAGDIPNTDGSMSLGVGFGDAVDSVGVEVNVGIISLDGFADDGQIGIKVHKIFPDAGNLGIAVGWSNAVTWGSANDAEETFYGVVTKRFDLQPGEENPLPLTVSAGVGTGSFRSLGAIDDNNNDPNLFGSVGLQVSPRLSVVSSWTGSGLNAGLSVAPFDFPLVLTAGASDITSNTDTGARFSASIGYGFTF